MSESFPIFRGCHSTKQLIATCSSTQSDGFVSMTVGEEIRCLSIQSTICDSDFASMTVGEKIR